VRPNFKDAVIEIHQRPLPVMGMTAAIRFTQDFIVTKIIAKKTRPTLTCQGDKPARRFKKIVADWRSLNSAHAKLL
jgi:hypothetical protein